MLLCAPPTSHLGGRQSPVIGCPASLGRVAEWQTRWLQVPVSFGTWGFKSPFAHRMWFYGTGHKGHGLEKRS